MTSDPIRSETRALIAQRSGGICERCGHMLATNVHHRRARGMGGTRRNIHTVEWLLHLCGTGTTGCHGDVEASPVAAFVNGWKMRQHQRPSTTPVRLAGGVWVILTPRGGYEPWGAGPWQTESATLGISGELPAEPF